ncbi:MAG: DUF2513 domain-containing protein [Verrucomicrobiota bacterium]
MKRDLNLVRAILLDIEAAPAGGPITRFHYEGKEKAEILEHIQLLLDAGLVEGEVRLDHRNCPNACLVYRMTWNGQEFVARAKNDTLWKKVLAQAEEKGLSTSMAVINGLLEAAAKKYVGLE